MNTASLCTPLPVDAVAANKAIAQQLIERFDADDLDGALALMSDDVGYWTAGKPDELPSAGVHDKPAFRALFGRMRDRLAGPLRMRVLSLIAEDDVVAMEVVSDGPLKNGRRYQNEYHMRLRLRDGLICEVREYYDSLHVHHTWFRR